MNQPDVANKTPRLHAACALNGTCTRRVNDVAIQTTLAKLKEYGRQLSRGGYIRPDDKNLLAFRNALNSAQSMSPDELSWRGKRAFATLVKKALALDLQLPK